MRIKTLLLIAFTFLFINNVRALDVTIESVELESKSASTEIVNEPTYENLKVNFDIKFKDLNDFVTYKIVINNKTDKEFEITQNNNLVNNGYVTYEYNYDKDNNIIQSNSKKILYITIKYNKEVSEEDFDENGNFNETKKLVIDLGNEEESSIVESPKIVKNPNTKDNLIIAIFAILIVITIALISYKKTHNKKYLNIIIIGITLLPVTIYALETLQINIESKIAIKEKLNCVSFADDSWKTIAKNIRRNNTSCYHVGDTKEVDMGEFGLQEVRISNMSIPEKCSEEEYSQSACGFVVEFVNVIAKHRGNPTDSNIGGWPASELRTYVKEDIYNALPEEIKEVIIETKTVSDHGLKDENDNILNKNFETVDKLFLLAQIEIFGQGIGDMSNHTNQIDYYKEKCSTMGDNCRIKKYNNENSSWWSRCASRGWTNQFLGVYASGSWDFLYAGTEYGVSPAFRIG